MMHGFAKANDDRDNALGKDLLAVLPECGHFPMIDDPASFVNEANRLPHAAAKKTR